MKILLISPAEPETKTVVVDRDVRRFEPPMALLQIGGALKAAGHEVELVDYRFADVPYSRIKDGEFGIIGFGIFIGPYMRTAGMITEWMSCEGTGAAKIVWGGIMPSLYPKEFLNHEKFKIDIIVRWDGEIPIVALANGEKKKNIPNLVYRAKNGVIKETYSQKTPELDAYPVADWSLLGDKLNKEQIPYYTRTLTTRGCPYKCSFCYSKCLELDNFRVRPAWHVLAEVDEIHKLSGNTVFTFGDDNTLACSDRAKELLVGMRARGFYLEQVVGHSANIIPSVIEAMRGVVQSVCYSIESGSQRILDILEKKLSYPAIKKINAQLRDVGIVTIHSFMVGVPTETDEDLRASVKLMMDMKAINPFARACAFLFYAMPKVPIREWIETLENPSLPKTRTTFEPGEYADDEDIEITHLIPKESRLVVLDDTIDGYKKCEMVVNGGNVKDMLKYRPWLTRERALFLIDFIKVFNDVFRTCNIPVMNEETKEILAGSEKMRELFLGVETINRPKSEYHPYVLNKVLAGDKIDIENGLKEYL